MIDIMWGILFGVFLIYISFTIIADFTEYRFSPVGSATSLTSSLLKTPY